MKKLLITGAGSYIGTSQEAFLSTWGDEYLVDTVDMIGDGWKTKDFSSYDAVFHVAGIAHIKETSENAHLYYEVNRDLAVETARKAKAEGVGHFIFLSTMAVYGITEGAISEKTKPSPKSHYGIAKYQAEEKLAELSDEAFIVSVLRPPMVYGEGCKGNYLSLIKFAKMLPVFPDYENRRSMIHIDKLCLFVKELLDGKKGGVFLPQDDTYVCTARMVRDIAEKMGKKMYLTKILNPAVILAKRFTTAGKKAFGDLYYEK